MKLNKALGYNGGVLEKGEIAELPYDLAQNIINHGNGHEYIFDTTTVDSEDGQTSVGDSLAIISDDAKSKNQPNIPIGRSAKKSKK